jgi:hypothetical protein
MYAVQQVRPLPRSLFHLAALTYLTGAAGMVASFFYLASSSRLDVAAGAAGFVAGSVLAAAGLLSMTSLLRVPAGLAPVDATVSSRPGYAPAAVMERWLTHYRRNRENRPEPNWTAPITLDAETIRPLVRSLEQFQLGDGGGPASLIARDAEWLRSANPRSRELVDTWFREEKEHARLLGAAVARFGGRCIHGHWSFAVFCQVRRWIGVQFELTVLLLTEIVSTVYYWLLRRHGQDPALRSMCKLILRDESGHVAMHRDRLADLARTGHATYGPVWEMRFRVLGLVAATMLWINHAPGLKAVGATRGEFYRDVWLELTRFARRLQSEAAAG